MNPADFILNIVMIFSVFIVREKLAEVLNDKLNLSFKIKTQWISYILLFWLTVVVVMGMLYDTKQSFDSVSVSESMQNLEPAANKKPHRFFDINFDIFNF
jgi:hypothetical protein